MSKATLILDTKTVLRDGLILQRKIWQLQQAEPSRPHRLKYRLYCGKDGKTIVHYDNETGKDDHRHLGPQEMETSYVLISLVPLLNDFAQDVARLSGEIK